MLFFHFTNILNNYFLIKKLELTLSLQLELITIKIDSMDKNLSVITDNWQIFSKKLFQYFIHHKKILKSTKFQFKIIGRSRVFDKNIPLWYIVHPTPTPHLPPVLIRLKQKQLLKTCVNTGILV